MDCPIEAVLADLPAAPLALGFSGGLDSCVLLHALSQRAGDRVEALHVDHGLQPDSATWAAHCQAQAAAWGLRCRVLRVEVERAAADGLEAAARRARYRALAAALAPGGVLALAHHRDDQAETVLLRLLRKAGPQGLAAMRRRSRGPFGLDLWRPLLDLPRSALQAYARRHRLQVLDDPMNADPRFDRVFLRQQIMPSLRQRWPEADAALAASAALLAAEDQRRERTLLAALAGCRGLDPASLLLLALAQTERCLRRPLLERWLAPLGAPALPAALLQRLAEGLPADAERGYAALRWGGWRIERHRNELHASRESSTAFDAIDWNGRQPLRLPAGELALCGSLSLPWTAHITPRRGGERLRLPGRSHRHALKDCLQALGLPPWERRGLPLLWAPDGQLAAAGDLLYAADFDAWLRAHGARLRWTPAQAAAG